MQFELARAPDEPALRELLRQTPFSGDIRVTLEREPCIHFANAIEGEHTQILVARPAPDQPVVAMGTRTLIECFVNGSARRIGYLGQLRVLPHYRARAALLKRGYATLRALHADGAAEFYLTTIIADNQPARRVLEAGLPGLPTYRHVGDMLTLLIATTRKRPRATGLSVERAQPGDVDDIVECLTRNAARYQFAPHWTRADLLSPARSRDLRLEDFLLARRGKRLIGCLACWDQRNFKQVVVRGYSRSVSLARPLANLLSPLTRMPRLPPVGQAVPFAYLSHLSVDDDDPRTFELLVAAASSAAAERGLQHVSLGLADRNPLAETAQRMFSTRRYRSRAYLVYWTDGAAAANAVDPRPIHLEVAIL